MKKLISMIAILALMATCILAVLPVAAEEPAKVTSVPTAADMHSYLVGTQSAYSMEDGIRFSKKNVNGYENLGTNYDVKTYKYDGLRLEFSNIVLEKGAGGETPRLAIYLTPNTDGASPRETTNKGLIFVPVADWFGANKLGVYVGALENDVTGWKESNLLDNVIDPYQVTDGAAPYALLNASADAPATYSFEMYKNPDNAEEYIVCISDSAWYKIPAAIVDQSLSKDATAGASYINQNLPEGECTIAFSPWVNGAAYNFTWSKVTTKDNTSVPTVADMHSYLVGTQSAYSMEDGIRFSKKNVNGYENLGTNYDVKTYKYDGLRLEFSNIVLEKGAGGETPRLAIYLTPNTDGASPRETTNKGLIFVPVADWFGANKLGVYVGALENDVTGWKESNLLDNVIDPYQVTDGAAPYALLNASADAPATYSFEMYKNPDNAEEYIVCISDSAWYKIPAAIVDQSLSKDATAGASYINQNLPEGECTIAFSPWVNGAAYNFTWSKVTTKASAPAGGGEGGNPEGGNPEGGNPDGGEQPAPIDTTVPSAALLHPYFASTGGFTLTDGEDNVKISKDGNLTGYEFIGSNYDVHTYKVDGLRLEFKDINMVSTTGSADTSPRISVGFTPYTDGKTPNADPNNIKGILFVPAAGFFGNQDLIVYLGAMADYPGEEGEWVAGLNVIEPYHVNDNAPDAFGYMTAEDDTFTIQFNKQGEEYIICINDSSYYKIPAVLVDYAISTDTTGLAESASQFIKADLEEGKAIMNFYTWTAGKSFDFTWSGLSEETDFVEPVANAPADDEDDKEEDKDDDKEDDKDDDKEDDKSPATGDNNMVLTAVLVLAACAMAVVLTFRKKEHSC